MMRELARQASGWGRLEPAAKLADGELYVVEAPCRAPSPPARSLVIRLVTDAGLEGWGEAPCGFSAAACGALRQRVLPALAGRNCLEIERLRTDAVLSQYAGLPCAVEMACWDLLGQAAELPLRTLWGGAFRPSVPLALRLPECESDQQLSLAGEWCEAGFGTLVAPSGGSVGDDSQRLTRLAEVLGGRALLRWDVAGRLPAGELREMLADGRWESAQGGSEQDALQCVLDPLPTGDWASWGELARSVPMPLAASVPTDGLETVLHVWRARAARSVVVSPPAVGGLSVARECAAAATAGGLTAMLAWPGGLGIAAAAVAQLASSVPGFTQASECTYPLLREDVLAEPLVCVRGELQLPDGPGLGVTVDRARLERYAVA